MAQSGSKWLKMAQNGLKWLEMMIWACMTKIDDGNSVMSVSHDRM
jgi:hypothetical protein